MADCLCLLPQNLCVFTRQPVCPVLACSASSPFVGGHHQLPVHTLPSGRQPWNSALQALTGSHLKRERENASLQQQVEAGLRPQNRVLMNFSLCAVPGSPSFGRGNPDTSKIQEFLALLFFRPLGSSKMVPTLSRKPRVVLCWHTWVL